MPDAVTEIGDELKRAPCTNEVPNFPYYPEKGDVGSR